MSTASSSSTRPTPRREDSDLDLVYVGNKTDVIMIEGAADELPEEEFMKALAFAQEHVTMLVEAQEDLVAMCGKEKRDAGVESGQGGSAGDRLRGRRRPDRGRDLRAEQGRARGKTVDALRDEVEAAIKESYPDATDFEIEQAFDYLQKKAFRVSIMEKGMRADGRDIGDLRALSGEVKGSLPRAHGSALFARGETQALAIATLAPIDERSSSTTTPAARTASASSCTTTSRRSASVKPVAWVA